MQNPIQNTNGHVKQSNTSTAQPIGDVRWRVTGMPCEWHKGHVTPGEVGAAELKELLVGPGGIGGGTWAGAEGSVTSNGCVQCGQLTAIRSRDAAACSGFPQ